MSVSLPGGVPIKGFLTVPAMQCGYTIHSAGTVLHFQSKSVDPPRMRYSEAFALWAFLLFFAMGSGKGSGVEADLQSRPRPLKPPDRMLSDAFSTVTGISEVDDNRVLVADRREQRLALVRWSPLRITSVGRNGDGPGEYNSASGLVTLAPGTSLLLDGTSRRWLLLDNASFVDSLRSIAATVRALGTHSRGGDRRGNVLVAVGLGPKVEGRGITGHVAVETADSIALVLINLHNGSIDTVVSLRGRFRGKRVVNRTVRGTSITFHLTNPLAVEEQSLLFPDGWIAVVHTEPYRVDWLSPNGLRIQGKELPVEKVVVDENEKQSVIRHHWRGAEGVEWPSDAFPAWPTELPPFPNDALFPAPDGQLLVKRLVSARTKKTVYDVIDRTGRRTFQLTMEPNERIVGSGAMHIYTVMKSADGLESLARHNW